MKSGAFLVSSSDTALQLPLLVLSCIVFSQFHHFWDLAVSLLVQGGGWKKSVYRACEQLLGVDSLPTKKFNFNLMVSGLSRKHFYLLGLLAWALLLLSFVCLFI